MGIIHACFGEHAPVGIILAIHSWLINAGRFGCVCRTVGLDQVRTAHLLVLPLPYVRRSRLRLYRYLFLGVPVQKAGWCARCLNCMAALSRLHFGIRYFGRDRSTTEGAQYEQTKLLPPDHRSRCGSRNGFLHSDLYWVRIHPGPLRHLDKFYSHFVSAVSKLPWVVGLSPTSSKFAAEDLLQVTFLLDIGVVSPWVALGCSGSTNSLVNGGQSSSIAPLLLCTKIVPRSPARY